MSNSKVYFGDYIYIHLDNDILGASEYLSPQAISISVADYLKKNSFKSHIFQIYSPTIPYIDSPQSIKVYSLKILTTFIRFYFIARILFGSSSNY